MGGQAAAFVLHISVFTGAAALSVQKAGGGACGKRPLVIGWFSDACPPYQRPDLLKLFGNWCRPWKPGCCWKGTMWGIDRKGVACGWILTPILSSLVAVG